MFKIFMPHQNTGALGIQIGNFYADLTHDWKWGAKPKLYINWFKRAKYYIGFRPYYLGLWWKKKDR